MNTICLRSALAASVFSSIFGLASIAQEAPQDDMLQLEGVAVVVNDEPISFFDVRQRARMLMMTLGAEPTAEAQQQLLGTAQEQLIEERLQLQAAAEFELEISDREIAGAVSDIAQQAGVDVDTLYEQFSSNGISPITLEEQMRADISWRRIMQGRFGSRIRISGNQIDDQIDRLRKSSQETVYQVAEIFLFAPDSESRIQAEAASASIVEQLRQGAPFRAAAQRFSSAPTAAAGGDMGWVSPEDLNPALAQAVRTAEGPGILPPITTENGIYILALRGRREPSEQTSTITLKQLVATNGSVETLEDAMGRLEGCDSIDPVAERFDDVIGVDLGTTMLSELSVSSQEMVDNLSIGQASSPFEISAGWSTIVLCDRIDGIENMPSRDQIENQLFGQELGMISDRELRNARREATILQR
ncbi:MAG: peptidylprolyl isomerase [Pseudomonadota bacterium]